MKSNTSSKSNGFAKKPQRLTPIPIQMKLI